MSQENVEIVRRYFAHITVKALTPVGKDDVLAELEVPGSGQAGGINLSVKWFQIATVRNRLITRMQEFAAKAEALEAVGLSE